jgi:hypothetical protein
MAEGFGDQTMSADDEFAFKLRASHMRQERDTNWRRRNPISSSNYVGPPNGFGYLVVVRADINKEVNKVLWVDFELFNVTCRREDGTPEYGKPSGGLSPDPFDERVEPDVEGFVKWDGCTQLYFQNDGPGFHADCWQDITEWVDAIRAARMLAAKLLPDWEEPMESP